jgi:hypothetical protein
MMPAPTPSMAHAGEDMTWSLTIPGTDAEHGEDVTNFTIIDLVVLQ